MDQTFEQQYKREENMEDMINHKQDPTYVDGDYRNLFRKPCIKPPQKRVSFDLREYGALKNEFNKEANNQNIKKSKLKVHSNSLLKVKINLNPFRKRRTHAQKNLNKEEIILDKNKKAASKMNKRTKLSIREEKGYRGLSETRNTDKHKPAKKSKKPSNRCLQDSHSDGMQMIATQPQNNQIDGYLQAETTDPRSEISGTSLVHTPTSHSQPEVDVPNPDILNGSRTAENVPDGDNLSNIQSMTAIPTAPTLIEEYLPSAEGSPKRKIRLILPERTSSRSQTPLDKKIQ